MTETYRLKTIAFLGRRVPVVVQSENGPCPMLAIANVMLLRNQIHLSPDAPEVTQERLLSLIAGHLLDVNARDGISEEQAANMTRIIADAVVLLPKLTTGIDVNVMFNDIRGFEYTDAIAIFDLLDIHLVHGWLVDPQDRETAAAIGRRSYNALMERQVALTGRASLTPAASQDSHQPLAASKPSAASAAQEEASTGDGAAAKATETPSGLTSQHASPLLRSEGVDDTVPADPSSAGAPAAEPASATAGCAAELVSPPVADGSRAAAFPEPPETAGQSATTDEAVQSGVPAGEALEGPADASEGLSEADELDLALKLSLHNTAHSSAASGGSTVVRSSQDSAQTPTAVGEPAGDLPEEHEPPSEHHAAKHAAVPAGESPPPALPEKAEGHAHAESLDHDFVVVEPEEPPGTGFEQVNMPTMGLESAESSQALASPHALSTATNAQQAFSHQKELEPPNGVAELPAEAGSQHGLVKAEDSHSNCKTAVVPAEPPTSSGVKPTAPNLGASSAESSSQPAPSLDERARALLAALPKPGLSEGPCAQPPEHEAASPLQQHAASSGASEQAAPGVHHEASEDAAGQKPCQLGAAPASQARNAQNAQIARMGSSKEAYLIQAFLDNASSQLTEHGLVSLHQGLKPRQLAILFRNNHFNTLFKFEEALYLLVTDQGYLHEQDVVWEKLDAIDGNTVYVGSQINRPDPAADTTGADLQLAMQLQQQEDAEHQQRLAAQRQQPGQPGQGAPAQDAPTNAPTNPSRRSRRGPEPPQAHHRRGRGAYRSQRHGQPAHAAGRGSSRDCIIM